MKGTVKYYNSNKGYGFLRSEDVEIFFHISNVFDRIILKEGQSVNFETKTTAKGVQAINIRPCLDVSM